MENYAKHKAEKVQVKKTHFENTKKIQEE